MALVESLLSAIVRADGDALVMHVGERPYVVVGTSTTNISTHGLNLEAMTGMLLELLPQDALLALEEFGAVEHRLPNHADDRFNVVAARGGDDIWIEIRRRRGMAATLDEPLAPPLTTRGEAVEPVVEPPPAEMPAAPVAEAPAQMVVAAAPSVEPPVVPPPQSEPTPVAADAPTPEPVVEAPPVEPSAVIEAPAPIVAASTEPPADAPAVPAIQSEPTPLAAAAPTPEPVVEVQPHVEVAPETVAETSAAPTEPPPVMAVPVLESVVEAPPPVEPPPPAEETAVAAVAEMPSASATTEPLPRDRAAETIERLSDLAAAFARDMAAAKAESDRAHAATLRRALSDADGGEHYYAEMPTPAFFAEATLETLMVAETPEPVEILEAFSALEAPEAPLALEAPEAPLALESPEAPQTPEAPREADPAALLAEAIETAIANEEANEAALRDQVAAKLAGPSPSLEEPPQPAPVPEPVAQVEPAPPIEAAEPEAVEAPMPVEVAAPVEPEPVAETVTPAEPAPTEPVMPPQPVERVAPPEPAAPIEPVVVPLTRTVRIEVPPRPPVAPRTNVERLLRVASARGASALFLTTDARPYMRVEGDIRQLEGEPVLSRSDVEAAVVEIAPESGHDNIDRADHSEWITEFPDLGRMRCMTFTDHRGPGVLLRMIATRAATAEQLGLSRDVLALATEPQGIVLVAGPRAGGKSTLMSALVDLVNRQRAEYVITLERQIRLVHDNRSALVSQREIRGGADEALAAARQALREGPDVLVVDDLLSPHMVPLLLTAASEGLLVFVAMTAPSTTDAVERFIELAPAEMRTSVEGAMAESFRGAVAQVLLKKSGGGLIAAREVLLATAPVVRLIGEGHLGQLGHALESGRRHGMVPFTDTLASYVRAGIVDVREAFRKAPQRDQFLGLLKREGVDTALVERLA
ncbi:MAG TPA: ATPase, T2SS/T4P/T4SS family [Vicinamibacterales bacterium]|nr:ATPase, T2SS/T4P/T4SS family [Vicinamibacterales bacterium]